MPLIPTNTRMAPPGGWSVTIEGLGPTIRSDNYAEFIAQVKRRLEANNRDEHGWKEKVLDLMCQQRPDIACEDTEMTERAVTSDDVKRWFRTLWEAWKSGATAVSSEEQDRRAGICRTCPKRGHVSCFGGCGAMAEALSQLVIGTKANVYPDLHKTSCLVCSCEISSLVLFPLEVLQKVDAEANFQVGAYPSHCWKLDQPNMPNPPPSSPQPPPVGT